jgi:hypothetical protein
MLDLDSCPFLKLPEAPPPTGAAWLVPTCQIDDRPWPVDRAREDAVCRLPAHASCDRLARALAGASPAWLASARSASVVAEACLLAQARLEVRAEQLRPVVAALFGEG